MSGKRTPLSALGAQFLDAGGGGIIRADGTPAPERHGVGVLMECPCGSCGRLLAVDFKVAVDGMPWREGRGGWERTGDTIDTLTLSPSVQRMDDCRWHGWIRDGFAVEC